MFKCLFKHLRSIMTTDLVRAYVSHQIRWDYVDDGGVLWSNGGILSPLSVHYTESNKENDTYFKTKLCMLLD
ncbi:Flagellar L-ring [Gossypium arboreum]|uniref:Flagellar L-ring n=1 Tax=Gossypium arboreum TaxID=29729 RepID=A0A0B0N3A3_GOSAR|nr:Flagellar L-ring [Gossypium arboreum]